MPDVKMIQEEQELVPGGDIRIKGNGWLRTAWWKSKVKRVLRESEFRKVVHHLSHRHDLCTSESIMFCHIIFSITYYNDSLYSLGPKKDKAGVDAWVREEDTWLNTTKYIDRSALIK